MIDSALVVILRALHWIVVQVRLFIAFLLEAYLKWRISRAFIDPNAKCPACGHRQGEIRWIGDFPWKDASRGAIVHQCKVCTTNWSEKPIVKADGPDGWVIRIQQSPEE